MRSYTAGTMESAAGTGTQSPASPLESLYDEAKQLLAFTANQLRAIAERYGEAHARALDEWHEMRAWLAALPVAHDARTDQERADLAARIDLVTAALGAHQRVRAKLGLAVRTLESTWLFLERRDAAEEGDPGELRLPAALEMRVLEAEEAERARLAQEVHDGPAQALSNAIFRVDYIDRLFDADPQVARTELRHLRDRLRRELADVRAFLSQLRPPVLDEVGLEGAIRALADGIAASTDLAVQFDFQAPVAALDDTRQPAVLRIAQEALQNVRQHADAQRVSVSTRAADGVWKLEVRDDGKGFDPAVLQERGRRSFGLGVMRERAALIDAQLKIETGPGRGTHVELTVPTAQGGDRRDG